MASTPAWKFLAVAVAAIMIVSLGAGMVTSGRVEATTGTWYVDPQGTDNTSQGTGTGIYAFKTIGYGVTQAAPGDTINVAAGLYNENINVSKALTLHGASSSTVTVHAASPTVSVFTVNVSNVNISGFTATGTQMSSNEGYAGIKFGNGVTGCNIHDNIVSSNQYGILLIEPLSNTTAGNNSFTNNTASSCIVSGIEMQNTWNNTFTNNTANSNGAQGFRLANSKNNTFTGNTANLNGTTTTLGGNGGCGFFLVLAGGTGSNNNTFTSNIINSNVNHGLRIDSGTGNTLTGNTFNSNGAYGIDLKTGNNNTTMNNNNCSSNSIGIAIVNSNTDATTLTVAHNNILGNTTYGISNLGTGTLNATNNWWGANDGPGAIAAGHGDKVSANVNFTPWLIIGVSTNPTSIVANGTSTSMITADMTKNSAGAASGGFVPDGTSITIATTGGTVGSTSVVKTTTSGLATATLTSSTTPGIVTVSAAAPGDATYGKASTTLTFIPGSASTITLIAVPSSIVANGTSTSVLTATVKDQYTNPVADGTNVVFTTSKGTVGSSTVTKQTTGGIATATLTSATSTQIVIANVSAAVNGVSEMIAVFFTPPSAPPITDNETVTVSDSGTIPTTPTGGSVAVNATGDHTVTIAKYGGDPGGTPSFNSSGNYYDVHVDNTAGLNSITIQFSPATDSTIIYYWTGTVWRAVSSQTYAGGIVTVTVTATTFPSLSDLDGLFFGSGTPIIPPIPTPLPTPTIPFIDTGAPTSHGSYMPAVIIPQAPVLLPNVLVKSATISGSSFVTAEVINVGFASGSSLIVLSVDGKPVNSQAVNLAPGDTTSVKFYVSKIKSGKHEITVNDIPAGSLTIGGWASGYALIFIAFIVVLLLTIGLLVFYVRRKRTV